jgi:hypothetical protein
MAADIVAVAGGVVAALSPFMPYLVNMGESVQKKLEEVIAEKGGEAAWTLAKSLWGRISARFADDRRVQHSAEGVALAPGDERAAETLTEVLAKRLEADPALGEELQALLGGPQRVIQLTAGHDAIIERVRQRIRAGAGSITLTVGDRARISDVDQEFTV